MRHFSLRNDSNPTVRKFENVRDFGIFRKHFFILAEIRRNLINIREWWTTVAKISEILKIKL